MMIRIILCLLALVNANRLLTLRAGGVSDSTSVSDAQLTVWTDVLERDMTDDLGVSKPDLQALGTPVSVQTQVVAGTNYFFTFANGEKVTVWEQTWTNKLEITAVEQPEPVLGKDGIGPSWTYGVGEMPEGERDMGGYTVKYYTPEQQARLGITETGEQAQMLGEDPATWGPQTQEVLGADPKTWGPQEELLGADPKTWGPQAELLGSDPDTWGPSKQMLGEDPATWGPNTEKLGQDPATWSPSQPKLGEDPATWGPQAELLGSDPDTWGPSKQMLGEDPATWSPSQPKLGEDPATWSPSEPKLGEDPATWSPSEPKLGEDPATWSPSEPKLGEDPATWSPSEPKLGEDPATWSPSEPKLGEDPATWSPSQPKLGEDPATWGPQENDDSSLSASALFNMLMPQKTYTVPEEEDSEEKAEPVLGRGSVGPRWTWDPDMEKPEGVKDMGSWEMSVYTEEQQNRLGVTETGEKMIGGEAGIGPESTWEDDSDDSSSSSSSDDRNKKVEVVARFVRGFLGI